MRLLQVLLFMTQDGGALREEARAADDFRADELRARIFRLTAGEALAAKIARWSPGVESSGAWEHDAAWTRLFLDLPAEDFHGNPLFTGRDLEPLFAVAFRGRTLDDDLRDILWRASERRMRGAVPEITGLLRDADPETRKHALLRLGELGDLDAVPEVLPLLADPDLEVRGDALGVLSRLRAKAAVPHVRRMLALPDPEARSRAVSALARIGDRESIPVMVDLLKDREPGVRRATVAGLAELGAWRRFPAIEPLLGDASPSVREAAVRAAEQLAGPEFPDLIRPLLRDKSSRVRIAALDAWGDRERDRMAEIIFMLRDEDEYVRNGALNRIEWTKPKEAKDEIVRLFRGGRQDYQVVGLLGDLGATEIRAGLLPILRDKDGRVQEHVAVALAKLGGPDAVRALVGLFKDSDNQAREIGAKAFLHVKPHEAEEPLLELLRDNDIHIRGGAASLLGEIGVKAAVPRLLGMLNRDNESVRVALGVALAKLGEKEGIEELRRRLKGGQPPERGAAAYYLREVGARETLPDFVEALTDSESWVRINAIEAIEAWGGREAGARISPHLGDKHTHWEAIHAVVRLSHRESAPRLIELLASPDRLVRARAAWGLEQLGASESMTSIRKLLVDPDPWVRVRAADALGGLGDSESVVSLRKLLGDDDGTVRAAAARALGDLGAREAVPDLVKAVRDPEDWVWLAATEALAEMGAPEARAAVERLSAYDAWPAEMSPMLDRLLIPDGTEGGLGGGDFAMNFVRRPMVWKNLEGKRFVRVPSDRLGEALERIAREADLPLEWPRELEADRDLVWASQWKDSHGPSGGRLVEARPRSALLTALEQSVRDIGLEAILEEDRIRLVHPEEARKFWRAWHDDMRKQR